MVVCFICKEEFKDNSGGQLTNHTLKNHNIYKEDYFILTKLDGVEPICSCGCNVRPTFYRNRFLKYASGHDNPEFKEKSFIEKNGDPTCETCGNLVKFTRGVPNKYCSFKCHPCNWNQDKVKETVKEKYGVDNIMEVEEFKQKQSESQKKLWTENHEKQLNKIKKTSFDKYGFEFASQNESIKEKQRSSMLANHGFEHYSKTSKFRKDASERMISNNPMKNPITVLKCIITQSKNNKWTSICKTYKQTDLKYQSSYEYDFLEFCENRGIINLIKKSPTFQYINKNSYHFPDYIYNNEYVIEIKSKWILELQGGYEVIKEKKRSVEISKYKYLLIIDKDYIQFENIII
jgi:hypothetical protein